MGGYHCLVKNMWGIPQLHVMLNILLKNWHVIDALTKGNCIHSSVHWIFHDAVGNKKVSAWWVPKELTEQHKAHETGISLNNLLCLLGRTILVFSLVMKHWSTNTPERKETPGSSVAKIQSINIRSESFGNNVVGQEANIVIVYLDVYQIIYCQLFIQIMESHSLKISWNSVKKC